MKVTKIFTLIVSLLCLLSFSLIGCGSEPTHDFVETLNDKTTVEVYEEIVSTIDSYGTNVTATTTYNIPVKMTADNEKVEYSINTISTLRRSGDNFQEHVYMKQNGVPSYGIYDREQTTESYYVDGVAYVRSGSTRNKLAGTLQQFAEYLNLDMDTIMNPIYDFSDTAFDEVKFAINKSNPDDVYFELTLSGDDAEDFAKKLNIGTSAGYGVTIDFSEIKYKFVITKDGVLDHIEIDYVITMTMTTQGVEVVTTMTFDGDIRFTNVGSTTISVPEDAADFTDLGNIADYLY